MKAAVLAMHIETLLRTKRTNFRRLSADQIKELGWPKPCDVAFLLPGSKSPLNHSLFLIPNDTSTVTILCCSRYCTKALSELADLEDAAMRLSTEQSVGNWVALRNSSRALLALKCTPHVNETNVSGVLWTTCAVMDSEFKAQEKEFAVRRDTTESDLQAWTKQFLTRVGFKKIKEMTLPNHKKAFLVVLSNESESVEECWKRFPMRFEVDKSVITLRVYLSVHDKAHTFESSMDDTANRIASKLNPHIPEGYYVLDSSTRQMHLVFRLACRMAEEESAKTLLQSYYETAIAVYKWSAWTFVQLILHPPDLRPSVRSAHIDALMAKAYDRSPNERKCLVLTYDSDTDFQRDSSLLQLLQANASLRRYLLPDPFLVFPQDRCVKVFSDTSLKPLEDAMAEGMATGVFAVTSFFELVTACEAVPVFPTMDMLKFKPSPLRLVLIPGKGFARTATDLVAEFQRRVIRCCVAAAREVPLVPTASLLYFSPNSFVRVQSAEIGPRTRVALAGITYLLWSLKVPYFTRRLIHYLEAYRAESLRKCGDNTVEGIITTDDDRFEEGKREGDAEEVNRFYLLERDNYLPISLPTRDFTIIQDLASDIQLLHRRNLFHGFISPATLRKVKAGVSVKYFVALPCLYWKYVEILYPVVPSAYISFLAPEITQLYHCPQHLSGPALHSCDVYSFARLLCHWVPALQGNGVVQSALRTNWTDRPTLDELLKEVEGIWDRSTLSTGGVTEWKESDKTLQSVESPDPVL